MHLGALTIVPVRANLHLVAQPVANALKGFADAERVGVAEIDPALSDTTAFCAHYKISLEQAANCVILEAKHGEREWLAACVVLGDTRADVNGLARKTLDARRVSFAPMERAVSETGMEYGAITPVGLPNPPVGGWRILIDKAVADVQLVVIGSGKRASKLIVPGSFLATLPNAQIVEGLGRVLTIT